MSFPDVRALLLFIVLLPGAAAAAEHIKIGGQKTTSPLYIAVEKGYFAAEGLDPELVYFEAGQPVAVATVLGDIDFGIAGLTGGTLRARRAGRAQAHRRPDARGARLPRQHHRRVQARLGRGA